MTWQQLENRIRSEIQPNHKGILKCRGDERRPVVSNDGKEITMRTGVKTNSSKSITYEMIKFAFEKIESGEDFDSSYYQKHYPNEYINGPCRYSMVGGILVEMEEAERIPVGRNSCIYHKK